MNCKGCGENKKLIKAHIIPESFWVGLRDGDTPPKLMTDKEGVYPKRLPIGVYDKNILCRDCEDKFQAVDDYAQQLLLREESNQEVLKHNGTIAGYKIENFDYTLLKLFFVSILWRASVSTHDFYNRIDIGPFADTAKQLIWDCSAGDPEDFSCVLAKFTDEELRKFFMDPHRQRTEGINYYRFYLYGYVLYIKVDKRQTPNFFKPFVIKENEPLIIIGRDINRSKEYPVLVNVAQKANG